MLPPVDPVVLQRNPNFEVLYKDLCSRKLNPNGSTRDTKKQRVHDEIRKSLTTARTNLLASQILIDSLSDLPSKAAHLPPDLHPCIETVTAQLNGQVASSDREILSGDIALFLDALGPISAALSTQLNHTASLLCTIADPQHQISTTSLPAKATALQNEATHDLPHALAEAHVTLTTITSTLLATHLALLETSIRILEQTQHGALSRHAKSSAELVRARAQVLGLQAKMHALTHAPPAEYIAALKAFKKALGSGERALRDREGIARREMEVYEKAGGKGMRDLARRKEGLVREIERVEGEVGKLEVGRAK
ncbi:uncharacterized protein K460DRAFT_401976 [Cucurbitaria berberidis CBS 394.84]|uniref:Uncharacterized protein n=1 Tax=Cucurbitaria berberidis CBS 394.84 TaxID=1168544 RepID=A0A9P4GVD4_9PLEO|nr:uncharacterized protein K460DRAFT_401976 [Cucurbitaria berberidis CBS 394.84]KAF1851979.1 hypothetical protein K460DRAFT_401976 [Cucurbitaria berberidis CBS 394.84]